MSDALLYAESHFDQFLDELKTLLRIPSVSTDPAYESELRKCADWMIAHLQQIGVEKTRLIETEGHPIVYGEHIVDDARPTILIYGHYDVQPPDPLELWDSDPFEPVIRDGHIFARGASDDKGQMFILIKAIESIFKTRGSFPCNLKFLIEGEEECGSPNVMKYIEQHPELLQADVGLACDTAMISETQPAIVIGMRGLLYTEITLTGANRDLHSGTYGGAVENPAHVLARLVAGFHDESNLITLPGFYDDVLELSESERKALLEQPLNEKEWLGAVGVSGVKTEAGYSLAEAGTVRPTLDVNGMWSGYTGLGAKTIIPAKASAKISCRLVPNQHPDKIFASLQSYLKANVPETIQYELRRLGDGFPAVMDSEHPAMQSAIDALKKTFGTPPYLVRGGGSIPVVATIKQLLNLDTIMIGFALESDRIHAPNENYGLERFRKGIAAAVRFLEGY